MAGRESRERNEVVERLLHQFPDVQEERMRSVFIKAHETFVGNAIREFVRVLSSVPRDELSRSVPVSPDHG